MGELDGLVAAQKRAAIHAAEVWANHVLGEAQRIVPLEEGTLAGSGDVQRRELAGGGFEIVISFSTPYAARQHEELNWKHRAGRQAKYLEQPFKQNIPRLEPLLAAAIRQATP